MFVWTIFLEQFNLFTAFVSKLGMVMHHLELDCRAKRLFCVLQGPALSEGPLDQNYIFSSCLTISLELQILSQPNLFWWHIISPVSCEQIAVFKAKVIVMVENLIELGVTDCHGVLTCVTACHEVFTCVYITACHEVVTCLLLPVMKCLYMCSCHEL